MGSSFSLPACVGMCLSFSRNVLVRVQAPTATVNLLYYHLHYLKLQQTVSDWGDVQQTGGMAWAGHVIQFIDLSESEQTDR